MFVDKAKIYIKAGKGGNGASHKKGPQYVAKNNGGSGGSGGNGGDALFTNGVVRVFGELSLLDFNGGLGGAGGFGGTGGGGIYGSKNGTNGSKGSDGKTGLENAIIG